MSGRQASKLAQWIQAGCPRQDKPGSKQSMNVVSKKNQPEYSNNNNNGGRNTGPLLKLFPAVNLTAAEKKMPLLDLVMGKRPHSQITSSSNATATTSSKESMVKRQKSIDVDTNNDFKVDHTDDKDAQADQVTTTTSKSAPIKLLRRKVPRKSEPTQDEEEGGDQNRHYPVSVTDE